MSIQFRKKRHPIIEDQRQNRLLDLLAAQTVTASAGVTAGHATTVGSAAFVKPTYAGVGSCTVGHSTCSGAATFTKPTYAGVGSCTAGHSTCSGVATFTKPTYAGTGVVTVGHAVSAGAAISAAVVFSGSASLVAGHATNTATATFVKPTYAGVGGCTAGHATCSGTATFTPTGQAALPVVTLDWSSHLRRYTPRWKVLPPQVDAYSPYSVPILLDLLIRDAEPPRYMVDVSRPLGWDGPADIVCTTAAAYIAAIAVPGIQNLGHTYVIEVSAGATYTGNFRPPNKTGPNAVVTRTSNYASLPPVGWRVGPADAPNMAKFTSAVVNTSTLNFNESSHDWHYIGIEVTSSVTQSSAMINLGRTDSLIADVSSLAQLPTRITIDQCYIHGTPTGTMRRGIMGNGAYVGVVDSYISDIHEVGADSQAFGATNGNGPYRLDNCYLEAAGENVMFGGTGVNIINSVPSDIYITRCHFNKPLTWKVGHPSYAGNPWSVKNLLEFKTGRRVWVEGCIFEHNWVHAQAGLSIVFTVRDTNGTERWNTVEDINFVNNIVREVARGINITGADALPPGGGGYSLSTRRLSFRNNLIRTDPTTYGSNGVGVQFLGQSTGLAMHEDFFHNTFINDSAASSWITMGDNAIKHGDDIRIRDNISMCGNYGVLGGGSSVGTPSLNTYFLRYNFDHNVMIKGIAAININQFPAGNFMPAAVADVGFTDAANGDYSLLSSSPYHNAASDGTDIGANFNILLDATRGVIEGLPADTILGAVTVGHATTSGTATFKTGVGVGGCVAGHATTAGVATFVKPTYTGVGSCTVGHATTAGSATFAMAKRTGTAAVTIGHATNTATATFVRPTPTGTGTAAIGHAAGAATATFTKPTYAGVGGVTVGHALTAGSAISAASVFSGSASPIAGHAVSLGSATFVKPIRVGVGVVTVGHSTSAGTAAFIAESGTGISPGVSLYYQILMRVQNVFR